MAKRARQISEMVNGDGPRAPEPLGRDLGPGSGWNCCFGRGPKHVMTTSSKGRSLTNQVGCVRWCCSSSTFVPALLFHFQLPSDCKMQVGCKGWFLQ